MYRDTLIRWETLLAEEDFPTRFVEAGEEAPFDVLLVGALSDEDTVLVQLELSFVPGMEEQLTGMSLVQCFASFAEVAEGAEEDLMRLLMAINSRLPLLGFGYLEEERVLLFRHMAMLPGLGPEADRLMVQTVWLISYLLDLYAAPLAELAAGAKSYDEVIQDEAIRQILDV